MQNIGGFFEKYKNSVAKQVQNVVFVMETVKKHTGIELEIKQISISGGVIRLKITSLEKNVIFIKKTKILEEINARLAPLRIKDIQ